MKLLPGFLRATRFEYEHRYLVHGIVYTLGLAAPWHRPVWGLLHNQSTWFLIADTTTKPLYNNFALVWNVVCGIALACAAAGAWLRVWGASYLGATTVHRGGMEGDRILASGPYRYVRNPLYLGTLLHSIALAVLMRPEAAALTLVLLTVVQSRLIGREEPYLLSQQGAAYERYCEEVPRLLPRLRSAAPAGSARPIWRQGLLSEVYMIGVALAFATVGWTGGFNPDTTLHVLQGIVIALGVSVAARAFIPKSQI